MANYFHKCAHYFPLIKFVLNFYNYDLMYLMNCFPNWTIKSFHFELKTMDPKDINIYLNLKGEKRMQLN